jgi:WD40 repeat protein
MLAVACGGDDGEVISTSVAVGETPVASTPIGVTATPPAEPASTQPAATPTATPEMLVSSVGPVEPLSLVPAGPGSALLPELYVYDVDRGAEILQESETYFETWREVLPALIYGDDQSLRLFDASSRQWLQLDLGADTSAYVASDDGTRAAVTVDGKTYLLDLAGKRTQEEIAIQGRPRAFSPDGTRLVWTMPEQPGQSPFVVMPVSDPEAAVRLPLGASPNEIAQGSPQWLDEDRLIVVSQNVNLLQVYDVSGATPQIILEEPIESDQVALSPDGRRLAVQEMGPTPALNAVVVYDLDPFARVARLENASLGGQLAVPREVWSTDDARLLVLADMCEEREELVSREIEGGAETVLTSGLQPIYRFVFSPDGQWVAFTAHDKKAYVVPAGGAGSPILVSHDANAPVTPRWTADSSRVAFAKFFGGYDICLV